MHCQGCNVRSHGLATGRQAAHLPNGNCSTLLATRSSKLKNELRAFAGASVVAPFVAAASNTRRSNHQQGTLSPITAAVKPASEFKETATYAKGKVQKVSILTLK